MNTIFLDENLIQIASTHLSKYTSDLSDAVSRLSRLLGQIDNRVLSRSDVGSRLGNLCKELGDLQEKLGNFKKFVENESGKYFDIEDYLVKVGLSFSSNPIDQYESQLAGDPFFLLAFRNAVNDVFSGITNSDTLLRYKDLQFKTVKKDGKILIQLVNAEMVTGRHYMEYRDGLVRLLGGESGTFKKRYVNRLINGDGIPLYVDGHGVIQDNMDRFNRLAPVEQFINGRSNRLQNMKDVFKSSYKDGMTLWDDFNWKNTTVLSKGGKFLGAAGTVLAVGDNFVETFRDGGKWDFNLKNTGTFAVNTTVDVAAGAGAAATGAVIGSFVVPPLGTVVGLATGVAINFALNAKFGGPPPKSVVDHTKDLVNDAVDATCDAISGAVSNIGKGLNKLIW
ncbi:hypothetical protein [Paenibacillus sp. FSL M7-1046]|uniref:hypothetical protein n=1 Tax=Paenibacillus sp. FSL M7-1046 TaxID=2975315 RepID=UPI0030F7DF9E